MPFRSKKAGALFYCDPSLQKLRGELDAQAHLLHQVRQLLPADIAPHCHAARIDASQRLLLFTDSPVWASRLRYSGPALEAALRSKTRKRVLSIRTIVQPCGRSQPRKRTIVRSKEAVNQLMESAKTMEDQGIGDALRRLANAMGNKIAK